MKIMSKSTNFRNKFYLTYDTQATNCKPKKYLIKSVLLNMTDLKGTVSQRAAL